MLRLKQKRNKKRWKEDYWVEETQQQPSPVPSSGHALAFSSLEPLFIRRRGGVAAVNGMFLHSEEV